MYNTIKKGILITFSIGILITLVILVFFREKMNIYDANTFTVPNPALLFIGLCLLIPPLLINLKHGERIERFLKSNTSVILLISSVLLLGIRLLVSIEGYFTPGWDAGTILNTTTSLVRKIEIDSLTTEYYSMFPNNMLITWVYTLIGKIAIIFNNDAIGYALLVFQSLICVLCLLLIFLISRDITGSIKMAWFAYTVAYLFVGLSPWFMIAYSDATGIVFPLLIIRLYQISMKSQKPYIVLLLRVLLGIVSMASFYIKPQLFISFIAVIIIDIAGLFKREPSVQNVGFKRKIVTITTNLAAILIGITMFLTLYNCVIVPSIPIETDPELRAGIKHYIMMGLNDSSDGSFAAPDYLYSYSFDTVEERDAADMELAIQRLREYGAKGLLRHLADKHVENYGDGTFGWFIEGGFLKKWSRSTNYGLGNFIKATISGNGVKNHIFKNTFQMIWLTLLFLIIFLPFSNGLRGKGSVLPHCFDTETLLTIALAVIGLTIFELLFEARARYLFCYAPFYVIMAAIGYRNICKLFQRHSR